MTQLSLFDRPATKLPVETRTRVWLQLAYLMSVESDALAYKCPRDPADNDEIEMLRIAGDRFYAKASEVAGIPGELPDGAWREAVEALGSR